MFNLCKHIYLPPNLTLLYYENIQNPFDIEIIIIYCAHQHFLLQFNCNLVHIGDTSLKTKFLQFLLL
jgi:hypothetical protein